MDRVAKPFRWVIPACLAVLLLASSAHAETTFSPTDPTTWWAWLMSRISVPGG